ncbi:hypothetical protein [Sphingomonas lutea]|uniref:hypothetical protein n=1 Tax=Sphingomonas lutea TaxID=1045317 RepID=UPI001FD1B019|nr:hypothetical protein [Sphingomonas lutea]
MIVVAPDEPAARTLIAMLAAAAGIVIAEPRGDLIAGALEKAAFLAAGIAAFAIAAPIALTAIIVAPSGTFVAGIITVVGHASPPCLQAAGKGVGGTVCKTNSANGRSCAPPLKGVDTTRRKLAKPSAVTGSPADCLRRARCSIVPRTICAPGWWS